MVYLGFRGLGFRVCLNVAQPDLKNARLERSLTDLGFSAAVGGNRD